MIIKCIECGEEIKIKSIIRKHAKYLVIYCEKCGFLEEMLMTGGLKCHHIK